MSYKLYLTHLFKVVGLYLLSSYIFQYTKLSGLVHTRGESLWKWTWRYVDLWNDLGFSLCAAPSVCCIVVISDNRKKSEIGVSANLVYHHWTLGIEFNKSLSLLIIRLVNYSVTTSLIYKFIL